MKLQIFLKGLIKVKRKGNFNNIIHETQHIQSVIILTCSQYKNDRDILHAF